MMKIGIEIHQRLDTCKLFCDCCSPAGSETEKPKGLIRRKLHPVLSELGEIDEASKTEFGKDREFEYQIFSNNCLVEIDEEPPHAINPKALNIVLAVAAQLHAAPLEEIHIMRKMVIDGSNTTGFQRTAIIALNGHVGSSRGNVRISTIALEEESAGIVSNTETNATYRLDRLGVPLIEITTEPDIKDGEHLREVAEKIGMILRTTGKVARGIGTIRQDLNVSTEGGSRVEIKGAQDLKMLGVLVENEARRQTELVKIVFELRERKALPIELETKDLTKIFTNTQASLIKKGIDAGASLIGQKLHKNKGLLGLEIQNGKRYGTEISDYAKLAGVKGIIHSDEDLAKYGITSEEINGIQSELKIGSDDAFVLVVAPKTQAEKALKNVVVRANMDYVPGETRKANPDGTTSFMRPIPGKARMYPETDVPPVTISQEMIKAAAIGETLESKKAKLETVLNKDLAAMMLKSRNLHIFEKLIDIGADPILAANTLENTLVSLRREGIEIVDLEKTMIELFTEYQKGTFVKAAIPEIIKGMSKGARIDAVLKVFRLQKITGYALEELIKTNAGSMQTIMQKFRLQVDPQELTELLKTKKFENNDYR